MSNHQKDLPEQGARVGEAGTESIPDHPWTVDGTVEKMSERWRRLQREGEVDPALAGREPRRGFLERHYVPIGIGIAVLLVALAIVIGGVLFLLTGGGAK
jgi:hypothetical protein